ncbi:uncharacterized protein LOC113471765, partial [Diaphorina citri]|uniref:Uncharacterized protein LOC113471765 n=1 Tax=Diaphorina citri TaxID=121845 RepID=A0A3Q0JEP3_DIACI
MRTNNKALEIKKDKLDHMKKNNRMDVYNELKLSVLNKDKKLKNKLDETNVGELNQMAYAPQSYFRDDATSGIKSLAGTPGGSKPFSPKVSFSNQNTALRLNGDPCCPDMSCLPKAVKCNPCCRTFDGRDLAFVFLFGLVVGLLSIIALPSKLTRFAVKPLRPEDVEDPELRRMLTTKPLFGKDEHYEKCAIVSNAGALRNSYLGAEIDGVVPKAFDIVENDSSAVSSRQHHRQLNIVNNNPIKQGVVLYQSDCQLITYDL